MYRADISGIEVSSNLEVSLSTEEVDVLVRRIHQGGERFTEIHNTTMSDYPNPDNTHHTHNVARINITNVSGGQETFFLKSFLGNFEGSKKEVMANEKMINAGLGNNTWTVYSRKSDLFLLTKHIDGYIPLTTQTFQEVAEEKNLPKIPLNFTKLISDMHCRAKIIHGDLQPKNMGIIPFKMFADTHESKLNGLNIIDFEHALFPIDTNDLITGIYRDLATLFSYVQPLDFELTTSEMINHIIINYSANRIKLDSEELFTIIESSFQSQV